MVLQRLSSAASLAPVLGPLQDAARACAGGDRLGTGLALAQLALDVGGLGAGPAGSAGRLGARGVGTVLKHTLKRRVRGRAREALVKVSLTAVAASVESTQTCRLWRPLRQLGILKADLNGPQFFDTSCADAQIHAILARHVYLPPSQRPGLRARSMEVSGKTKQGEFWYTYVAGDLRRGFWFCPDHGGHLTTVLKNKLFVPIGRLVDLHP